MGMELSSRSSASWPCSSLGPGSLVEAFILDAKRRSRAGESSSEQSQTRLIKILLIEISPWITFPFWERNSKTVKNVI